MTAYYPSFEELCQWWTFLDDPVRRNGWLSVQERSLCLQWFHDRYVRNNPGFRDTGETFDLKVGNLPYDLTMVQSPKPNVLFFSFDHKGIWDYGEWIQGFDRYSVTDYLSEHINHHDHQHFYLFTPLVHYERMFRAVPNNLTIDNWTQSIFFDRYSDFRGICPVGSKDHTADKHFVSLNNMPRMHRYLTVMYLLGIGADRFGHISLNPVELESYSSWQDFKGWWRHNNQRMDIAAFDQYDDIFDKGFRRIKQQDGYRVRSHREWAGGSKIKNQLQHNFTNNLIPTFYDHTVLEIVTETLFFQEGGIISEKYVNTVYGKNLPILICFPGVVSRLRQLGFDMYDDVVDHGYDEIDDPLLRLVTALETNRRLLMDALYARQCWQTCEPRMQHNIDLAQMLLYQTKNNLNQIISRFQ